jgi:hypothetical protein
VIYNILHILGNDNDTPENENQKLVTLLNSILEQNYLQFKDQFHKQTMAQQWEHPPQQS